MKVKPSAPIVNPAVVIRHAFDNGLEVSIEFTRRPTVGEVAAVMMSLDHAVRLMHQN